MVRWKTKCGYKAGRYPVIALLDLFFLLLILFVLSNSMLYLPGMKFLVGAGEQEEEDVELMNETIERRRADFSEYIEADKLVLIVDENGRMELNTKEVSLEQLDDQLVRNRQQLQNMYRNTKSLKEDDAAVASYRPKLVLYVSPKLSVERIDVLLGKIRNAMMDVVFKITPFDEVPLDHEDSEQALP